METQASFDYRRIAEAIRFIQSRHAEQLRLEDVAAHIHLSPFHAQRLFTDWAGVSPKKFIQYLSLEHAKDLLRREASVFETAMQVGFSGPSRLHDLFVRIEGVTPGQYKRASGELQIRYRFADSPFGLLAIAATPLGVCYVAFDDTPESAIETLGLQFPGADIKTGFSSHHEAIVQLFRLDWSDLPQIKLHLRGTPFQLKVWEALLKIPMGRLTTYGTLAGQIGHPTASRAVGTAVGANPIAFLIPCHRVIRASGALGGYHWGEDRKSALIAWESARVFGSVDSH